MSRVIRSTLPTNEPLRWSSSSNFSSLLPVWATVLILLVTVTTPARAQVNLQWKFKEGDKFYIQDTTMTKQRIDFQGQRFDQSLKLTMVVRYEVKKVEGEVVTLQQHFENVEVESEGSLGSDADNYLELLKGSSLTLTLKGNKVAKFEGFQEFINQLLAGNNAAVVVMFKTQQADVFLRQCAEEVFGFSPAGAIKTGERWKSRSTVPIGPLGQIQFDNEYRLESGERASRRIALKPELSYSLPPEKPGGMTTLIKVVKGVLKVHDARGTIVFDPKSGRLVRYDRSVKYNTSLALEIEGTNQIELGLSVEQTTDRRVTDKPQKK